MNLTSRIESFFSERFDARPAMHVPSGRLGLWLAFRHTLPPASRVLLTPVTCDQVPYALLAAGMIPVFGPVNPATGNLDLRIVSPEQWTGINAVLTTNLYGVPDDMALLQGLKATHGFTLIEDACHAFDSMTDGRRIGSFGACSVFSLAKHVGGAGAVLLFKDEKDRPALQGMMSAALGSPWLNRMHSLADRLRRRFFGAQGSSLASVGHRTAIERPALDRAIGKSPDIRAFDLFLGGGDSSYRCMPTLKAQAATVAALEQWDSKAQRIRENVRTFRAGGLAPAGLSLPDDSTLLRVPLFVENREKVIAKLASEGIRVSLVYDPPLHEHFPWLPSITGHWSPAQSKWCAEVLPIPPEQLAKASISHLARQSGHAENAF